MRDRPRGEALAPSRAGRMSWTFPGPAEMFIYNSHRLEETLPIKTRHGFSNGLGALLSKRVFEGGPGYLIGVKL